MSELPLKTLFFFRSASTFIYTGHSTAKMSMLIPTNKAEINRERGLRQITFSASCWDSNSCSHFAVNHKVYFIILTFFHLCERHVTPAASNSLLERLRPQKSSRCTLPEAPPPKKKTAGRGVLSRGCRETEFD